MWMAPADFADVDVKTCGVTRATPGTTQMAATRNMRLCRRTSLTSCLKAVAIAERFEHGYCSAGLQRLRGVFLASMGAEESQIETSFCEAIRIAKEQKSVSLEKRAEATYAEYHRQKASGSGGRGILLPLF
jgi:hypothetical protein